jgi:hypothetical protein
MTISRTAPTFFATPSPFDRFERRRLLRRDDWDVLGFEAALLFCAISSYFSS